MRCKPRQRSTAKLWPPVIQSNPIKTPLQLVGVYAVVGCDGSGKSTLTTDLLKRLIAQRPAKLIYLGQSSGSIGAWIKSLPLIGPSIGRFLIRKAERSHGKRPGGPDLTTALVTHLLSQWRAHKFHRMLALARNGVTVITDRYPQSQVPGFYFDGPGLVSEQQMSWLVRLLARRELKLYKWMSNYLPTLVIRLNIDADTAHARKPDHKLSTLKEKTSVIPTLHFNGASILDLDARAAYPEVLETSWQAIQTINGQALSVRPSSHDN